MAPPSHAGTAPATTFTRRIGERPLVVSGLLLQAAALAWIAVIAAPGLADAAMLAPMFVSGAGFAMALPALWGKQRPAAAAREQAQAASPRTAGREAGARWPQRRLAVQARGTRRAFAYSRRRRRSCSRGGRLSGRVVLTPAR